MSPFSTFAGIEIRYHLRRPVNYIFMVLMLLGGWLYTATPFAWAGPFGGAVDNDAPHKLNTIVMFMTLFGAIFTPAIAGTALLRDFEFRSHELLFTTRLRKFDFVLGRFLGACLFTALVTGCSALGLWLGAHMPWVDPARLGPGGALAYVWPVLVYVVPNAFVTCAVFIAVGVLTRSFLAVYVAGIVMFVGRQIGLSVMDGAFHAGPQIERIIALIDPFGLAASGLVTRHWTIDEQNTRLIAVVDALLWNRLLWLALGGLLLLVAYRWFRMEASPGVRRRARSIVDLPVVDPHRPPRPRPPVRPRSGPAATWAAFVAMTRLYFRDVTRARPFQAVVAVLLLFMLHAVDLNFQMMITLPVTHTMVLIVQEFGLFFSILLAVYAGQLIWRERDLHCDQLLDATPVASVAVIAAKIAALLLVQIVLLGLLLGCGVIFQALSGYMHFELPVYFGHLFGLDVPRHTLTILLAVALQLLVPHKGLGVALLVAYYVLFPLLKDIGLEHRLLRYADLPQILYSDMNGFGPNVWSFAVLWAYYFAFAMLLLAFGRLLLVRGTPGGLRARLRIARGRATGAWWRFVGLAAAAWLGLGAYAAHNFHVRNTYVTERGVEALQAVYERAYKQYEGLLQPQLAAVELRIDLSPETASARVRGTYRIVNTHEVAVPDVHLHLPEEVTIHALSFAGGATLVHEDPRIRHQIWQLAAPLAPGAETTLRFELGVERTGFAHRDRDTEIHANGALQSESQLLPWIGYDRDGEVADRDARRRLGLPERARMLAVDDPLAKGGLVVRHTHARIDFSTTVCTAPDQIAVAPGALVREWQQDGRRCFAYVVDNPILNSWVVQSARYEVARERHAGIDLEIYYHADHPYNIARMMTAMKRSLDYYQAQFTPYQARQLRILEFPRRHQDFAMAMPGTIPFSEGIGFILKFDPDDATTYDRPFWITAHEVAHQWWGHQVSARFVQGGTMVIESLSEYFAILVMEQEYGIEGVAPMLREKLEIYLRGRAQEREREVPLVRSEGQEYIRYAKGMIAFYGLADLVGKDRVNAALAEFLRARGFGPVPQPIADDVIAALRAVTPPQYQYFITDTFETITLYDNRICDAAVTEEQGRFRVRVTACARKVRADEHGRETPAPLADTIEVGVFTAPGPRQLRLGKPLALEKHVFTSKSADDPGAELVLEFVVDERPAVVAIDPYYKLIESRSNDNFFDL
ncbi:ABC transporter permease/M1 family aminopeptidase [Nannocystis bainbridge]|uniref:M1 family aminopeptidase n=1 Tax=Nannocystis bainbridge TaxID=2995303 RepID=A0ABT5DSH5_9BACT|nr:M1 family aminopeptidase [Nannocystis bainbridge]MDC0716496.1 M1 family aminopeptidase [Nannocystis bainbridge]